MDGDALAEREPGFGLPPIRTLELDEFRHLAFSNERRTFRNAHHIDDPAGRGCLPGNRELVNLRGDMGRGCVHLHREIHGDQIPAELPCLLDVLNGPVCGGEAGGWALLRC